MGTEQGDEGWLRARTLRWSRVRQTVEGRGWQEREDARGRQPSSGRVKLGESRKWDGGGTEQNS